MTDDKKPRTIRAKFILNWKKDDSGGRRAKARLICQGFRDPDALNGSLTTASPTLTRLSRNMVMSISAMLDYIPFTADITTAFLQGKKYDPNSSRVIWIKLPRDAEQILGLQGDHGQVMKLTKPMYGLVDAPKAWFDEAVTRIMDLGKGSIVQHPLDSCLFLKFDRPIQLGIEDQEEPQLLAIFDIHVDDLFGAYDQKNPLALDFVADLQKIFKFREWHEGSTKDELTYCGTQICKAPEGHWRIHQGDYFKKQKPITIPKSKENQDTPVTEKERTALRGLLGALQWPATQTSPHLQSAVSLMAGCVTAATTKPLESANKALRYAKANADVGLDFRHLGPREDMTFVAFSDASFGCRPDLASQGGFLLLMVNKDVAEGTEGYYNILDWRSWKLARIARSTLKRLSHRPHLKQQTRCCSLALSGIWSGSRGFPWIEWRLPRSTTIQNWWWTPRPCTTC